MGLCERALRPLIFLGDLPIADNPLPHYLDDAAATRFSRVPPAATRSIRSTPCLSVTEKVEALYARRRELPADDEGAEMRKLRAKMHRRMLGNGHCARPVEMDCHFESICESCAFFVTTLEFRPPSERQRDNAAGKGQIGRQKVSTAAGLDRTGC